MRSRFSDNLDGLRLLRDRSTAGMNIATSANTDRPTLFRANAWPPKRWMSLSPDPCRCGLNSRDSVESGSLMSRPVRCRCSSHSGQLDPACVHVARHARSTTSNTFMIMCASKICYSTERLTPQDGHLKVRNLSRPGTGLEFKHPDAEKYEDSNLSRPHDSAKLYFARMSEDDFAPFL